MDTSFSTPASFSVSSPNLNYQEVADVVPASPFATTALTSSVQQNPPVLNTSPTPTLTTNEVVDSQLEKIQTKSTQKFLTELSKEEHESVLEKMRQVVHLPAGHLPKEDELYLEQQLGDMLGFEVSAESTRSQGESIRLNHSIGVMEALPHLRRYPGDLLEHHDAYREAGLSEKRGGFGWFTEMGQLTPEAVQREKYYIALQATFLPNWSSEYSELRSWLKFRKMIVINPEAKRAVITAVGEIGPADWMQHQFGGSPEVIREGLIWGAQSNGRVLVFFVNDLDKKIGLGPISLEYGSV